MPIGAEAVGVAEVVGKLYWSAGRHDHTRRADWGIAMGRRGGNAPVGRIGRVRSPSCVCLSGASCTDGE